MAVRGEEAVEIGADTGLGGPRLRLRNGVVFVKRLKNFRVLDVA
jgi:hypothetical protein